MTDRSRCDAGSRMEPNTEDLQAERSDEHWLLITDLFANPKPSPQGGRPMADPRACFEGCCGCSVAAPAGKTCRRVFRLARRSIADLSSGLARVRLTGRGNA